MDNTATAHTRTPHSFTASEAIAVGGHALTFEFSVMDIRLLRLFQVYFTWPPDQSRRRFHMQRKGNGTFQITDKHQLPQGISFPEKELSQLIINQHQ